MNRRIECEGREAIIVRSCKDCRKSARCILTKKEPCEKFEYNIEKLLKNINETDKF